MLAEAQARVSGGTGETRAATWSDRHVIQKPACRFPARVAASLLAWTVTMSGVFPGYSQSARSDGQIDFNIPAQPLARALMAYGAATGFEIFYDAALAEKQHSVDLVGRLQPPDALRMLLRGTGYSAKATMPGAFTIVPAPRPSPLSAVAAASVRRRLEPYFAAIQARIDEALCRNGEVSSTSREFLFQFWLAPSGVVEQAQVIDEEGERADDQTPAVAIRGLALAAPPAGMPQPVNMVIFPPSGMSKSCGRVEAKRGAE
jgi:hypothetical protein